MLKARTSNEMQQMLKKRNGMIVHETAFNLSMCINESLDGGFILDVCHWDWPGCNSEVYETNTIDEAKSQMRESAKKEYLEQLEDLTYALNECGDEYQEERADVERRWNALVALKGAYYATADDTQRIKNYIVHGPVWMLNV